MVSDAALSFIDECKRNGIEILGVDGLKVIDENIMGRIDLILDISDRGFSVEHCARLASEFVKKNANEGIVFDVFV